MVNLAIVGYGYWGPNLVRNFAGLPDVNIRYICDSGTEALKKARNDLSYLKPVLTTKYEDVLGDSTVEAVIIATPPESHARLGIDALNAGKHVLIEKPLALAVADGIQVMKAAKRSGKLLMVGHTFEYNPAVRKLKEIIRGPDFGKPLYLYSARLNLGVIRNDINALWSLAPHDLSILMYLLDAFPLSVVATGHSFIKKGIEDLVFVFLVFPSGVVAHVHVSWLDPSKVRRMTIVGEKKMVIYDDVDNESKLKIYDRGFDRFPSNGEVLDYQIRLRAGDIHIPSLKWVEPLKIECRHFVECITQNTVPLTDGMNGMRVLAVLEAAEKSLKSGGANTNIENPMG